MSTTSGPDQRAVSTNPSTAERIPPAVKSLLENVLVPAMVKQYIAALASGTQTTEAIQEGKRKTPESKRRMPSRKESKAHRR